MTVHATERNEKSGPMGLRQKDTTKCIVPWEWINFPYIKFLDSDLVAYGTFTKAEDNDLIEELESR